jgi:hypothetical protein
MSYLYLISSLKDSFVNNNKLYLITDTKLYSNQIEIFIRDLLPVSRKGSNISFSNDAFFYRFSIIEGTSGKSAQARILIECPRGWRLQSFEAAARKGWKKVKVAETLLHLSIIPGEMNPRILLA